MTKEQIVKAIPETLNRLNLPEISHMSDIEFDGDSLTLELEKYPSSEYLGYDKEALNKRLEEDMKELREAFKKLEGEAKETIYDNYNLDRDDSEEAEDYFIASMEEIWNIIRFPSIKFKYVSGTLEYEEAEASEYGIYPFEIIDIYEPSSYFWELASVFSDDFLQELEKVSKEQEGSQKNKETNNSIPEGTSASTSNKNTGINKYLKKKDDNATVLDSDDVYDGLLGFKRGVKNILPALQNAKDEDMLIITFLYYGDDYEYNAEIDGFQNAEYLENLLNNWIEVEKIEQALNDDMDTRFDIPMEKIRDISIRVE